MTQVATLPPFETSEQPQADAVDPTHVAEDSAAPEEAAPPAEMSIEVPVRMLQVVGVAVKENGRYCIDGVLIETNTLAGLMIAAATDGRRLVVAEWNRGLFDDDVRVIVAGNVARSGAKLATGRAKDDEPMAVVKGKGEEYTLTVFTPDGEASFSWRETEQAFPPYRDVIPDWSESIGVATIAITPELVAGTLKTMQKVVGPNPKVRVYLPSAQDKPIGFESRDGDAVKVVGVVMPAVMEEWTGPKAEAKPETSSTGETPMPASDDSWRAVTLEELGITKPRIVKALTEREPPLATLGAIADWTAAKGDFWCADIPGIGPSARQEIEDAMQTYWAAHPQAAKPAAPAATPAENGEAFDDDTFLEESVDTTIDIPGMLQIGIAQRAGGRWACVRYAFLGKKELELEGTERPEGHYPDRAAAIVAASDQVQEFIRSKGTLKGNAKRRADEIVKQLQLLDEKLRSEGQGEAVANPVEQA